MHFFFFFLLIFFFKRAELSGSFHTELYRSPVKSAARSRYGAAVAPSWINGSSTRRSDSTPAAETGEYERRKKKNRCFPNTHTHTQKPYHTPQTITHTPCIKQEAHWGESMCLLWGGSHEPPPPPSSPLALSALTIAALITPNQPGRYKRRGRRRRIGTKSEKVGKKRHHITVSGYPSPYLTRRTFSLVGEKKKKKKSGLVFQSDGETRLDKKKKNSRGPGLWISSQSNVHPVDESATRTDWQPPP